jgi:hypothetical protein
METGYLLTRSQKAGLMKASIDRIEGTIAVLIPMDDGSLQLTVPLRLLPIGIEKDIKTTRAVKEREKSLIEGLTKRK